MQYSNLYDLITCLEYGNNIHICVVFLNKYGNFMTNLPTDKVIHSRDFCTFMKSTPEGFRTCYKCRNLAINKAVTEKKPFGGLCFNGIYEYCHPVVENGTTVAVICIGNIISSDTSSYNPINVVSCPSKALSCIISAISKMSSIITLSIILLLLKKIGGHDTLQEILI